MGGNFENKIEYNRKRKKLKMEISEETGEIEGRGQMGDCVEDKRKEKTPLMCRRKHIRCCRSETLEVDDRERMVSLMLVRTRNGE